MQKERNDMQRNEKEEKYMKIRDFCKLSEPNKTVSTVYKND